VSAPLSFRERLAFDEARGEIRDQSRRYMLIRPDALMGVFRRLPEPSRTEALQALADSIFEQGSDSARAYRAHHGADGEALAHLVADTAPQLGWGLWRFEIADGRVGLTVANSPFAAGYGRADEPVCHPVVGMLRAVSTLVFGREGEAREAECAACGADACRFAARPREEQG
jgi:predicted hydrocarbon binding protein